MALTDNLVSYWKLDESSGNASDSVGSNTLTINGDTSYTTGKINNGARITTYIGGGLSNASNLGIDGGNVTIGGWFKMDTDIASGEGNFIAQYSTGTDTGYGISYYYNGGTRRIGFWRLKQGVSQDQDYYNVSLGTTWHFLVLTYNGTNVLGYLDGAQVTSASSSGNGVVNLGSIFRISGCKNNSNFDEVGIWSRALSSTEVTELYNSGSGIQYPFSTAITLVVATMSLSLTYASVALKKAIIVVADTMSLALTFADVTFGNAYTLVVDTMALTLTYADVTLKKAVKLVVDTMSLVLDFKNVILKKIGWNNDTKPTSNWNNDTK